NRYYVFAFTDDDLAAKGLSYVPQDVTERGPDLGLAQSVSSTTAATGASVTYTLTLRNNGLVPAEEVLISDDLPAGLNFASCDSSGVCGGNGDARTVAFAALPGAASQTAQLSATLDCSLADGTSIANSASAA